MKEMVGGCCVCSDERGWPENPLVYCDGQGCTVAVHQACYGIVTVPTGNWYCRKCESQERNIKVKCELCPNKDGALKPTDNNAWAHVVCALYIPEVRFGNVTTMEPIILAQIPAERYNKTCYICEEGNRGSRAGIGACMQCNKSGCRQQFHVTCAQGLGLLCEEAGNYLDNVKYCGYCHHHYTKLKKGGNVKVIPPYRPIGTDSPERSPNKETDALKATTKRKLSTGSIRPIKLNEEGSSGSLLDEALPEPPKFTTANFTSSTLETDKLGNKRRKGGAKTPPVISEDSRPSTPNGDKKPGGKTSPIQVKPPIGPLSIPVTDAAPPAPQSSSSPPVVQMEPSPPLPQQDHPIKRARSQSSDKSEKGRRSKRAGSKPTPPPPSTSPLLKIVMEEQSDPRASKKMVIKEEKDIKLFQNGVNAPHMLGNQLNPSSTMAQKMCDTLSQEMVAHSVFSPDHNNLVGPQLPKSSSRATNAVSSAIGGNWNHNSIPQSLEQLLERQWEQGSQFLMEQAQHFDIASLLSCLHQLRAENAQLEEHVNTLIQRRDHLLAVNARLAIPLVPPVTSGGVVERSGGHQASGGGVVRGGPTTPAPTAPPSQQGVVENGLASPSEQQQAATGWRGGRTAPNPHQPPSSAPAPSFPPSNPPQSQNSVVVRTSADLHRRVSQVVVGSQGVTQQQPSTSNTNSFTSSHFSTTTSTSSSLTSVAAATSNPQQGQQTAHPPAQTNQGVLRREVGDHLHHPLAPSPSSKPS